jgi:hypothetical protein
VSCQDFSANKSPLGSALAASEIREHLCSFFLDLPSSLGRAAASPLSFLLHGAAPPPSPPAMARPPQEAIDTFVSITGADEAVAVRKLEVSLKPLLLPSLVQSMRPESRVIARLWRVWLPRGRARPLVVSLW